MAKSAWSSATDEASGRAYYFNTDTQETSWELPCLDSSASYGEGSCEANNNAGDPTRSMSWVEETLIEAWANPAAPAPPSLGETPWYACYSVTGPASSPWVKVPPSDAATGQPYYFNSETQTSQWERPDDGYESPPEGGNGLIGDVSAGDGGAAAEK